MKPPYYPRWANKIYAKSFGYFWIPCPICNEYFGGHEWAETLQETAFSGKGVCPKCADEAKRRNKENEPIFYKQMKRADQYMWDEYQKEKEEEK